jgi:hypothetical protein
MGTFPEELSPEGVTNGRGDRRNGPRRVKAGLPDFPEDRRNEARRRNDETHSRMNLRPVWKKRRQERRKERHVPKTALALEESFMSAMTNVRRAVLALGAVACGASTTPHAVPAPRPGQLLSPGDFDAILDPAARSRALFAEASRVLFNPRCANCHPDGDAPTQRDGFERHDPPVVRGDRDQGIPGLMCTSCHQDANAPLARVPGAPKWQLAPREMAWQNRSAHEVCAQLKDPERNGHRPLGAVVDHVAHDALIGWAWSPGADRAPPPGSQAAVGALMAAWVATGAECPPEDRRKVVSR